MNEHYATPQQAPAEVERLREALQNLLPHAREGCEAMRLEAVQYHESMKGYRPERHAALDDAHAECALAIHQAEQALLTCDLPPLPEGQRCSNARLGGFSPRRC